MCEIEGCSNRVHARQMCRNHYECWRRTGSPIPTLGNHRGKTCAVDECERSCKGGAWGYCRMHYHRFKKHGDPSVVAKRERKVFEWVRDGYRVLYRPDHPNADKAGCITEHRFVMTQVLGRSLLSGENVHHKNGNTLDNSPENLELWVTFQPQGQRPEDLLEWAEEVIRRYGARSPSLAT